ncbi:MAG: adenylate kinase family protein [Candidatus Aenigmatarchaeota archaeon]
MKIAITGTPGTGKTTIGEKLAEETSLEYISINDLARERDCIISHDEDRNSDIVDVKELRREVKNLEDCILDGHLSHFMDNQMVFVLRCKPSVLKSRLEDKGWKEEKVAENVDAEITGVIEREARNGNEDVYSIDTTDKDEEEVVGIIKDIVETGEGKEYKEHFDWIEKDEVDVV